MTTQPKVSAAEIRRLVGQRYLANSVQGVISAEQAVKEYLLTHALAVADALDELSRIKKSILKMVETGYRMVNGKPFAAMPKGDLCDHNLYSWEECGTCTDECLTHILEKPHD